MSDELRHSRCDEIVTVRQAVFGNGQKGLVEKVDDMQSFINQVKGSITTMKFGLTFIGISNIALLIKLFGK